MSSETEIANIALGKLGEARVTSIDDNVKAARAMKARFAHFRDAELEANSWKFAVKITTLAASTETPAYGYSYIYERPVDDLRPLVVGDSFKRIGKNDAYFEVPGFRENVASYEIIDGKIYTDLSAPLKYRYISRVTDTGSFSPLFAEALASRLAADACEEMTNSNTKRELAERAYAAAIKQAKRVNALYNPPRYNSATSFGISRF